MVHHPCADVTTSDATPAKRRYFRATDTRKTARQQLPVRTKGHSWRPASPSSQSRIPCWTSREGWLKAVEAELTSPEGDAVRRTVSVSRETVMAVAVVEARAADGQTGRGVATSHDTVARIVGCSARTVRRVRTLLEKMHLATTVVAGRYLTTAEREEATQAHGGRQIRIASTRNLTMTQAQAKKNGHLPRRGKLYSKNTSKKNTKQRRKQRSRQKFPLTIQKLAGKIALKLPHLAAGHIGALCQALVTLEIDPDAWTPQRILDALERKNRAMGLVSIPPSSIKKPIRLFLHECRQAGVCDSTQATPPPGFTPRTPVSLVQAAESRAAARAARQKVIAAEKAAAAKFKADPVAQQQRVELMDRARRELRASTRLRISAKQRRANVLR